MRVNLESVSNEIDEPKLKWGKYDEQSSHNSSGASVYST
jgi:hypothetical protein